MLRDQPDRLTRHPPLQVSARRECRLNDRRQKSDFCCLNWMNYEEAELATRFFDLPVIRMAVVIFATTYVIAAAVFWCATRFWGTTSEATSLIAACSLQSEWCWASEAFTAAQVWGDLERASNAVTSRS